MNELRAQAYMPPLKYNTSVSTGIYEMKRSLCLLFSLKHSYQYLQIAAGAQKWANTIACSPRHTPKNLWKGQFTGENLAGIPICV